MNLYQGLIYAALALVFSVYLGFLVRLYIEKIRTPFEILFSLFLFTAFLLIHLITPLFAIFFPFVDDGMKKLRKSAVFKFVLLVLCSPILGIISVIQTLPANYNLLISNLHSNFQEMRPYTREFRKQFRRDFFSKFEIILKDQIKLIITH
ncbi:hypothetical protein ACFCP7_27255 [Paenibacillus elgii]